MHHFAFTHKPGLTALTLGISLLLPCSRSSAQTLPNYLPTDGLVGWWPFNGNANDESGNGNDGAFNGAVLTFDRANAANQSAEFDGVDDYISLSSPFFGGQVTSQFTISGWVKKSAEGAGIIWGKSGFWKEVVLSLTEDNRIHFFYAYPNPQGYHGIQTDSGLDFTTWSNVVVTQNSGVLSVYLNGELQTTGSSNGQIDWSQDSQGCSLGINYIGKGSYCQAYNYFPFEGKIDDIGIWNRALTDAEVMALYLGEPPVAGCTDATACNFNPEANADDGSCVAPGCTDASACNYDAEACAGGACEYAADLVNEWASEVFGDFVLCEGSGYQISGSSCVFNPGSPNQWPWPALGESGAMSLGTFGAPTQFTLAFDVKPGATQNGISVLFDASHGGSINWVMQYFLGNGLWNFNSIDFQLIPDEWQSVRITYNQGTTEVYRNGVLIAQGFRIITYNGQPAWYMGNWPEGGRRFNGSVDNVLYAHGVLSEGEVQLGQGAPGAVQFYDFEEASGPSTAEQIDGMMAALNGWVWSDGAPGGLPENYSLSAALDSNGWLYPQPGEAVVAMYASELCSAEVPLAFEFLAGGCSDPAACNYTGGSGCVNACVYPAAGLADCAAGGALCGVGMVWDVAAQTCTIDPDYIADLEASAAAAAVAEVLDGVCGPGTVWDTAQGMCTSAGPAATCASDLSGNGSIGIEDLLILLSEFATLCLVPEPVVGACGELSAVTFDGYNYPLVAIGSQCWFKENLRTAHYRNGDPIPGELSDAAWTSTTAGAQAVYGEDPANLELYGRLYSGFAVEDSRGVCSAGWHVPSDQEWMELELELGMTESEVSRDSDWRGVDEGTKLKSSPGDTPPWDGSNLSGFAAEPAGSKGYDTAAFYNLGNDAFYWTSTQYFGFLWFRLLDSDLNQIYRVYGWHRNGFSIRCLQD